jgi:hypothetical protein
MPTLDSLTKARMQEAEKAAVAGNAMVRVLQEGMYAAVIDWVVGAIETDGGRITYSAKNLGRVNGLYRLLSGLQKRFSGTMLGGVLEWISKVLGANSNYFKEISINSVDIDSRARRIVLQRWGYNTITKELIPGGYIESLLDNTDMARKIARLMNQAIAQKLPLAQFQKAFRRVFVGKPGEGMLEKAWKTNTFDLYQRIDRTAQMVYADKLQLNYAIYSGTLKDNSRPFCIARVNRVFDRKQIAGWSNLSFKGKPAVGYDPFTDCGGYQCRHHLSWISEGVAQHLLSKQK